MRDRILHTYCTCIHVLLFIQTTDPSVRTFIFIISLTKRVSFQDDSFKKNTLSVHVSKSVGLISLQVLTVLWYIRWWTRSVGISPSTQFLAWWFLSKLWTEKAGTLTSFVSRPLTRLGNRGRCSHRLALPITRIQIQLYIGHSKPTNMTFSERNGSWNGNSN